MEATEEAAANIMRQSTHSRQFWHQLLRRGAPIALKRYAHVPSESEQDDFIWRATVCGASFPVRHLPPAPPHEWVERADVRGIAYALDDESLAAFLTLSFLGAFRYQLEGAYRIAAKGVPVELGPEPWRIGVAPSSAIHKYQSRRDRFETLLGRAGLWLDPGTLRPLRPDLCGAWQVYGARRGVFRVVSQSPRAAIAGPYLPAPYCDIDRLHSRSGLLRGIGDALISWNPADAMLPYDALLARTPRAVEAALGATVEELTLFLYALYAMVSTAILWRCLEQAPGDALIFRTEWPVEVPLETRSSVLHHLRDACVSGYLRSTPYDWVLQLTAHAHEISNVAGLPPLAAERCRDLVNMLTQGRPEDLGDRPYLFTRLSERTLVLDLLHAPDFLHELFVAVGTAAEKLPDATLDERRARLHEEHAGIFFARELEIPREKMLVSVRIGKRAADIDLAFVFGGTLFVIDCKATAKDSGYYAGMANKWRNRLDAYREELETKCPKRAALIRDGAARPIIVPEDFDSTMSLVRTATVEYLPDDEPSFWCGNLATVGPPEE